MALKKFITPGWDTYAMVWTHRDARFVEKVAATSDESIKASDWERSLRGIFSMRIDWIDHFVLTVRDIEATCEFYSRVLGMQVVTFGDNRKALLFGEQKINLHQTGREFEPKALNPTPGSGDVCFITQIPLKQVIEHITSCGVKIVEGPVRRTGAGGPIESIYMRDPDGNLIEISNYLNDSERESLDAERK